MTPQVVSEEDVLLVGLALPFLVRQNQPQAVSDQFSLLHTRSKYELLTLFTNSKNSAISIKLCHLEVCTKQQ